MLCDNSKKESKTYSPKICNGQPEFDIFFITASQHSGTIDEQEEDDEDESEIHCYVCDQVHSDLEK